MENVIEVGDLVKVKIIDRYGIVDSIYDDFSQATYSIKFAGCSYENGIYTEDRFDMVAKKNKDLPITELKQGDFVKINNSCDCYNGQIAEVVGIVDKELIEVDVLNDGHKKQDGEIFRYVYEYVVPYKRVTSDECKEVDQKDYTDTSKHYAHGIQPIEYIQQVLRDLPVNAFEGACIKDIIKYCSRYGLKDDKQREAKKILYYALWLYMESQNMTINPRTDNHEEIYKALFQPKHQQL